MQYQVEEIVLLPTKKEKKHRNENEAFLHPQTNSHSYKPDGDHRNILKR